jgi:N,N'-diacetylchitobiose phosphorylase
MQYGYFDDKNKEYIITQPDTPESWSNYLGSTEYGAIITNNAGGYSFYNSAAIGRFTRLRPNAIPMDQPGRYLYIRDNDSADYWSASWQPVGKPLDNYKSTCRHGSAYSIIESEYSSVKTETTYFVPLGRLYECWKVKITNSDTKRRNLRLFTFMEFASNWQLWLDIVNLQYSQYILTMDVVDTIIDHGTNIHLPPKPDDFEEGGQARHTFFGIAGTEVSGYDTDRKAFIGAHRSYHNPVVVEKGQCTNSIAIGDNGCGTLQVEAGLEPGETKEFVVIMGIGKAAEEGKAAIKKYENISQADKDFEEVRTYWHSKLQGMTVETPDSEFNSMMNMWSPYNCLITYAWSRAASLVYNGERNGLGYRDTVQDLLGVLHNVPDEAGKRLELMITGQVSTGGAMPVVKPFSHNPGNEMPPKEDEYRSDDCLWLFNTIPAYVKETGNIEFYHKVLPYADKGKDTVLGHLRKSIEFSLERSGTHQLPCGLSADWNDCLVLGQKGESVFVALQLRYAFKTYIEICRELDLNNEISWAEKHLKELDARLDKYAWDGAWYLRAYRYDGLKFGSAENEEGQFWLNPQTWAVISEHAGKEKAEHIMTRVKEKLATEYGIMICSPPYEKTDLEVIKAPLFNPGMKENAGIFCHTQGWAIIAETMLGHGNQAYEYFRAFMPAAFNTKAEIRETEPYVYSQSTHSKYSPRYGASRLPWLTGAATWAYFSAIQYILGIRPEYDGLTIDPCIPSTWKGFKVTRIFKGKTLEIEIDNPEGVEKGVRTLTLNNEPVEGNKIPETKLKERNRVKVVMG